MEEIRGKFNTAISFAKVIEDKAREQIRRMCNYDFTEGSKIRIMPDVHAGKGCTIGTTMTVTDKAVPGIVGFDIGCGMYTVKLETDSLNFEKIDEAAHYIPSRKSVWDSKQENFDLTELICYNKLEDIRRIESSLGTLGGGNHFIEIDKATDGTFYLIIHTGSRNLGGQVAEIYQQLAIDLAKGKDKLFQEREEIIATYKSRSLKKKVNSTLKKLEEEYRNRPLSMPKDLCFVFGKYFQQYLHDMEICQAFAMQNRELIAKILLGKAGLTGGEAFHTTHNYIDTKELIIRKGAIAAHKGERVLIPINMRDGSVLAVGKGNPDWNYSAPHGAGRIMSRTDAKELLDMDDYKESMTGIYTTSINKGTLDESPQAYKSLDDIIDVIGDTVDIIEVMKPVYNFKAGFE